jgi:uracil phosphoribosyltransferase
MTLNLIMSIPMKTCILSILCTIKMLQTTEEYFCKVLKRIGTGSIVHVDPVMNTGVSAGHSGHY